MGASLGSAPLPTCFDHGWCSAALYDFVINFGRIGAEDFDHVNSPCPSLLKALSDANWEQLLPRLTAYAGRQLRRVGWVSGKDLEPNRMSVMDAVDVALERCLDGSRRWNEAAPPELGAFLCGVIKSIVSDERKKLSRDKADLAGDTIEEVVDPSESMAAADEDSVSAVCAAIEACVQGDEDLELFRLAVSDGNTKREHIAAALGWTPDQVTAARIK